MEIGCERDATCYRRRGRWGKQQQLLGIVCSNRAKSMKKVYGMASQTGSHESHRRFNRYEI
ncbi:hypothetical protein K0M31_007167 [Melipona bicolor]|uniref:Uncharacterized protein n=1 Tax=Melipona bicolor TaxID=60889 RepID=A0AA40FS36_9HYME|nr:hypothetical protein K0M31_007167 [Melipona bicolor]